MSGGDMSWIPGSKTRMILLKQVLLLALFMLSETDAISCILIKPFGLTISCIFWFQCYRTRSRRWVMLPHSSLAPIVWIMSFEFLWCFLLFIIGSPTACPQLVLVCSLNTSSNCFFGFLANKPSHLSFACIFVLFHSVLVFRTKIWLTQESSELLLHERETQKNGKAPGYMYQ